MAVNLHTTHYRFGIDELAENTHGWHAAEDVNPAQGVIGVDTTFLLRFTVQETGGTAAGNTDNLFQYNKNAAGWNNITTTSTVVKAVAAAAFANAANCTKRLSGTGTFETSGAGCTEDGLSGGAPNDIAASGNSETECGLQIASADVVHNDSIQFRLTSPDFTITNDVVPTITVSEQTPVVVTPGTLAMVLATFAPVVILNTIIVPSVLALTLSTFAPTVTASDHQTVTPSIAALTTSTFAPVVTASDHKTVVPDVASLTTTSFAPSVILGTVVTPSTATLSTSAFAPSVTTTNNQSVTPGAAALSLSTFAPSVTATNNISVTPATASLATATFAPTVTVSTPVTMSLQLVATNDPNASPIRVRVPSGVMSIKIAV